MENNDPEELADIIEVVRAFGKTYEMNLEELIRWLKRRRQNGVGLIKE